MTFLTYDATLSRVVIALASAGYSGTGIAVVQRSADQIQWATVRGCESVPVSPSAPAVYDYEFTPGAVNYYRVQAAVNANSGFETNVADWTASDGGTFAQSGLWAHDGSYSGLLNGDGSTAGPAVTCEQETVSVGDQLSFAPWLYSPQGWADVRTGIAWYTSFRVGAFLNNSALGASDFSGAYANWQSLTGLTLGVSRAYYSPSSFGVPLRTDVTEMIAAGIKICIDLQPAYNPVSATDLANMTTFLQALQTAGAVCDISLWHEPLFAGLTAAQYTAMIAYYGPTVRTYYPLVLCLSGGDTDPVNGYYPGSGFDKIAVDAYAGSSTTQITNAAAQADVAGVPFGIWEFNGSTDPVNGQSQAAVTTFFNFIQNLMTTRAAAGKPNADLIYFSSGNANSLGTGLTQEAGFEGGTGNWGQTANCTIATSTAQAHSGTHSLALTATGTSTMGTKSTAAAGYASGMAVTPGQVVSASAWFRAATAARTCQAGVIFYTSGGAVVSTTFGTGVADSTTGWTQAVITNLAVPATSAWAIVTTQVQNPGGSGEVHYLDDVSLAIDASSPNLTTPVQFSQDYRIALLSSLGGGTVISQATADTALLEGVAAQATPLTVTIPSGVSAAKAAAWVEIVGTPGSSVQVLIDDAALTGGSAQTYTDSITPVLTSPWLKNIRYPFLNIAVDLSDASDIVRPSNSSTFVVIGRQNQVAVTLPRGGRQFTLTIATTTDEETEAVHAALNTGDVVLLQVPADYIVPLTGYYSAGDTVETRQAVVWTNRWISVPLTETDAPGPDITGSTITWTGIVNDYGTWSDLVTAEMTWGDVLTLVGQPGDVLIP